MRAVLVSEFGGPEQLRLGQAADPVADAGQVRIAVHAAGVNPVDAGNRADGRWAGLRVPCILGYDVAGVVDSVVGGVSGLAPGDRVMAMTHFPDGAGGYAELVVVDAGLAAPVSPAVSFAEAAATPLAAGTAQVVLSRLGLPAGSRLLVLGPSTSPAASRHQRFRRRATPCLLGLSQPGRPSGPGMATTAFLSP